MPIKLSEFSETRLKWALVGIQAEAVCRNVLRLTHLPIRISFPLNALKEGNCVVTHCGKHSYAGASMNGGAKKHQRWFRALLVLAHGQSFGGEHVKCGYDFPMSLSRSRPLAFGRYLGTYVALEFGKKTK